MLTWQRVAALLPVTLCRVHVDGDDIIIHTCRQARCGYIVYCLFVCTVTDFSGEDKASGVEFFTVVHGRLGQGISHFGELCFPRSPKSDESASAHRRLSTHVMQFPSHAPFVKSRGVWT